MKHLKVANEELQRKHEESMKEVQDLLKTLKKKMDKEAKNVNKDWGNLGSLNYVKQQLENANKHWTL